MKKIAILGSTGSIGTQALNIIQENREEFEVTALTAGRNIKLLAEQIREYGPKIAVTEKEEDALQLRKEFNNMEIFWGMEGLIAAASESDSDMVLNALVGMIGLLPTYYAIKEGKDIALANKETLVAGGQLIMDAVKKYGARLLPVDSEHSAIFQCLQGNYSNKIKRIILTASGGPFRGYTKESLQNVTVDEALAHPNWNMGAKISVDSATMMNKGLEVIEAYRLFEVPIHKIDVVIHPQSIIHSMVEYEDHSIMAQMGLPDMRVPIQYAFTYPNRQANHLKHLDLTDVGNLTFEKPDYSVFQCLKLAYEAVKKADSYAIVLNAANEVLVQLFLEKKIKFLDIQNNIVKAMESHNPISHPTLDEIIEIDGQIREKVLLGWS